MIRAFLLLFCWVWAAGAAAASDFAISLKSIDAARPATVTQASPLTIAAGDGNALQCALPE